MEPTPAEAASGLVRFLVGQGVRRLLVVADASRRGQDFADRARATGAPAGVAVDVVGPDLAGSPTVPSSDAAAVATGWDDAGAVTTRLTERPVAPARGVYLAPWLLRPDLLEAALRPHAVQVAVGASLAPTSPPAAAYLAALARFAPGAVPTGPGMAGYLETRLATAGEGERGEIDQWLAPRASASPPAATAAAAAATAPARLELFTPVRVAFLPEERSRPRPRRPAGVAVGRHAVVGALEAEVVARYLRRRRRRRRLRDGVP